jgi:hypothetical protein
MYQNPLSRFIVGKRLYYDRSDLTYKILKCNVALNTDHIVTITSTNNEIKLDSAEKVYHVLLTDDNFYFASDQVDIYCAEL